MADGNPIPLFQTPGEWVSFALAAGLAWGDAGGKGLPGWWGAVAAVACGLAALCVEGGNRSRGSGGRSPALGRLRGPLTGAALIGAFLLLGLCRGMWTRTQWEHDHDQVRAIEGVAWVSLERAGGWDSGRILLTAVRSAGRRDLQACAIVLQAGPADMMQALLGSDAQRWEGLARIASGRPSRFPGDWDDLENLRAQGVRGRIYPILVAPRSARSKGVGKAVTAGAAGAAVAEGVAGPWPVVHPPARVERRAGLFARMEQRWTTERQRLRDALSARMVGELGSDAGDLGAGLLLGRRAAGSSGPALRSLSRAGAGHLLAVSGLNVALVGGILHALLRLTPARGWLRCLLLCTGLSFYGSLVGWSASVARAAGMGLLWAVATAAGRKPRARTLIGVALAFTLWLQPSAWRAPGFQLTYLVSLALIGAHARPPAMLRGRQPLAWLARTGLAVVAAQTAAWPLLLRLEGAASPLYLLSNAVLVPLAGLVLGALVVALFVHLLPGYPQDLSAAPAWAMLAATLGIGQLAAPACEGLLVTGSLSRHTALLAGIAVAMTWQPGRIPLPARGLCAAAIVVAVTLWGQGAGLRPRLLLVDVGQGEAWVLFWQEETWVIDVGPVPGTEGRASRCLVPVLRSSGRLRIDRLILTHDDMDHTGGLGELSAAGIPVRFIHHPRNWTVGPATSAWISRAAHAGTQVIPLARGDTLRAAEGRLAVLHPPPQGIASGGGGEKNAECLAFHIAVLGMNGIVCADSPQGVIEGWIAEGLVGPSDFISAAHHGSAGSASSLFLARAQPRVALISVARDNRFGLPDRLTLATLDERGIAILRTDRDGTVVIARCGAGWAASGYASGRRVVMVAERRAAQAARGF